MINFSKIQKSFLILPYKLLKLCKPRFYDWFDALNWMSEEISKINFDIALLGCGAYGFPLAARIKKYGKNCYSLWGSLTASFWHKGGKDEK